MANTNFVNNQTVIVADWLNDVNTTVYDVLGDGTNPPANISEMKTNLGLGTAADENTSYFATAAQGALADTAVQPADIANMLETSDIGVTVQGYDVDTAKTDVAQTFTKAQRGTPVSLTSTSSNIAVDFAASNNFTHTFTENTTLANPTNIVAGQSGSIMFIQGSTPYTLAYSSYWKFSSGTVPTVTSTANAEDLLVYYVESATRINAKLITNFS